MIRLGKMTDYALILMTYMARNQERELHTSGGLAQESRLPLPTVTKVLKGLQQGGLLVSHRGTKGGYSLARGPREISVAEVIAAIEGPLALTECCAQTQGVCELEPHCPMKENSRVLSRVVRGALEQVMLADLTHPLHVVTIKDARGRSAPSVGFVSGRIQ